MVDDNAVNAKPNRATSPKECGRSSPSGFVLKLYQMVNGAPDDIISWVPSGEAFRISDLARLESETLPSFFRHSRFQSLVRQLNFYNFRKINRERTFWVYHHPLFHRDRPQDLHRLRRRTCPGFDGRRSRSGGGGGASSSNGGNDLDSFASSNPDDMTVEDVDVDVDDAHAPDVLSSLSSSAKVSRSPSPSSTAQRLSIPPTRSEINQQLGVGNGSVLDSTLRREGSSGIGVLLKSVVSEEERSPIFVNDALLSTPSWTPLGEKRTKNDSVLLVSREISLTTNGDNLDATLSSNFDSPVPTKRSEGDCLETTMDDEVTEERTLENFAEPHEYAPPGPASFGASKSLFSLWPSTEKDGAENVDSERNEEERQEHSLVVAHVSRQLDEICREHASTRKHPSSGGCGGSRGGGARGGSSSTGLYNLYHPTSCRVGFFTYDDEFVVEYSDVPVTPAKADDGAAAPDPPVQDPRVVESIACACRACDIPTLFGRTHAVGDRHPSYLSGMQKFVSSAIASFCLSTHPSDPDLSTKIFVYLKKWPMLSEEFDAYRRALSPGALASPPPAHHLLRGAAVARPTLNRDPRHRLGKQGAAAAAALKESPIRGYGGGGAASPIALADLRRDLKTFSINYIDHIIRTLESASSVGRVRLTEAENGAMIRCFDIWKDSALS